MRVLTLILCLSTLFCTSTVIAQEPIINYNVHVIRNTSPSQCPSMWKGQAGDVSQQYSSGFGEQYNVSAAIQSCTGCVFDSASRDCVCQTCYVNVD